MFPFFLLPLRQAPQAGVTMQEVCLSVRMKYIHLQRAHVQWEGSISGTLRSTAMSDLDDIFKGGQHLYRLKAE